MTTLIFILSLVFVDKYTEQMTKNVDAVYQAATVEDLQKAVNIFERIGGAEKTKWEPYYYAAYGYVMISVREQDAVKKDSYLDHAKAALDKASAIKPDDSEIVALEGFIHMMRVSVDPASRGQQGSMMAMQTFGKAIGIDPQNPRALALMAQMQFGPAQFFKQAPTEACETAKKALSLFETAQPADPIAPRWGKGMTEGLLKGCQ
jgi:tetratricopeptide (TPR) repeat protein